MKDLRKVVPPKREILKGIWLSFYDGAKIGVLGLNGAGKSSLLRIMAGVDHDFIGEAFLGKGKSVGFLSQERSIPAGFVVGGLATVLTLPIFGKLRSLNEPADRITEESKEGAQLVTAVPGTPDQVSLGD